MLDSSGTVWPWENNSYFELGDVMDKSRGEAATITFTGDVVIAELFAEDAHVRAIDADGDVSL